MLMMAKRQKFIANYPSQRTLRVLAKQLSDEIEEDISKKTASKEMKVISEKTPSEYTNCTFESDDTTPSKSSTLAQTSTLNTETHVEDDHSSLTGKNRDLKQARTATAVNKQLNFTVKNKPHTTNYIYCIFEAYFMIKSV